MADCPCGSGNALSDCCGPFLSGAALPPTAEALMRSRYSAYSLKQIDYLKDTSWPAAQPYFDSEGVAQWAAANHWAGLTILKTEKGGVTDRRGTVLFEARYLASGRLGTHRERSLFRKKTGRWYYMEALDDV